MPLLETPSTAKQYDAIWGVEELLGIYCPGLTVIDTVYISIHIYIHAYIWYKTALAVVSLVWLNCTHTEIF